MKIRVYQKNKICCLLSKKDLEEYGIKINDFSANTEEEQHCRNKLLLNIIEQAKETLYLDFRNIPVTVEVIPINENDISLVISKAEDRVVN